MRKSKKLLSVLLTLAMLLGMLPALGVPALATSTTVTTKTDLMNAVKQSGEIVLGADIVLTDNNSTWDYYPVKIGSGIEITLDLNGHVLDRSRIDLGQNESRGGVIENNGTLVIKDSDPSTPHTLYKKAESWRPNVYTVEDKSGTDGYTVAATITGGAIIGGYNNYGAGINNSGTLILEGGTICGNEAGTKGGGVWNQSSGTFTMTGGTICSNKTTGGYKWGGGGVQNDGTFLMTGGTITGNTLQYPKGGGVFNAGTFQISGSPIITGNGNGNVYLMSFSEYGGKPIEVVGALTEDANVGVYPEDTPPITVTTGFKTYMDGQDQTKYFSSDLSGWMVMLDADGEVLLSKPEPVSYVYYTLSGTTPTKHTDGSCETYTIVKSDTTDWTTGWYVASGEVTIADRITVTGEVNLILTDGATLTASSGITISEGNTLNIYAQTEGTGTLIATSANEEAAGIGGGNWDESGGTVTIHGGKVTALGNSWGAGIGGGNGGAGGMVTIYDGNVTATGGSYEWGGGGAGIGGGFEGVGSTVTIYGGDVNANGGHGSAGIGGGSQGAGGTVVINNGTVIATGGEWGAGIGSGSSEDNEINGGVLTVNGGAVTANGGIGAAGIGGGNGAYGATVIANGGVIKTSGGKWELPDDEAEDWGFVVGLSEHNDEDSVMYYYGEGVGQGVLRFEEGETPTENKGTITLGDGMVVYGAATADPETSEANLLTLTDGDYTRYHYMTIIAGAGSPSAVAAPTFSPEGGSYTEAQTVTISCQTDGATIYYTADGTDPTTDSTQYTAAITVSETTTLKAIAVKEEMADSAIASATYTIGKSNISPTVTMADYTYGSAPSTPSVAGNPGSGTVTYYYNTSNSNSGGTEWDTANPPALDAGTYYMYATVGETEEYNGATTAAVSFTVESKSLTASLTGAVSKAYDGGASVTGATANTLSIALDGVVNGDDVSAAIGSAAYAGADKGTGITVTASGIALTGTKAGNYTLSATTASADVGEITAREITVTAADQTVELNGTVSDAADMVSVTGGALVSGHTIDSITLTGSSTASVTDSGTITPSAATIKNGETDVTDNYAINYAPGVLTVTPEAPIVDTTPTASAITYGQALSASTISGTMKDKYNSDPVPGSFTWNIPTTMPAVSDSDTTAYAWTFTPNDTNAYGPARGTLTVTVDPAPLTVKADNKTGVYRYSSLPSLTYAVTGLVNNDTAADVLTGELTTDATMTSPVTASGYSITQGTLALAGTTPNYTLTFTAGTLTMRKAAQDAPASGEGYTVADGKITVKSDTNANANNETHYEVYDGTTTYAYNGGAITVETGKTYQIRWAGGDNYEPSPWTAIVTEATVTATASPAGMGEITGLAEGGKYVFGASATLTATPKDDTKYKFVEWQDASGKKVSGDAAYTFTVTKDVALTAVFAEKDKTVAALPTTATGLVYNGSEQTGMTEAADAHYTWADGSTLKATNAGTYNATAKLDENCVWPDGTTADLTLTWSIDKAKQERPTVTVSGTTITITGSTDNIQYSTDGGKTWTDGALSTGTDGTTYQFRYKGDNNHYESPATIVRVNVPPTVTTIAASDLTSTGLTLNGTTSATDGVSEVGFQYRKASESAWTDAAGTVGKTFNAVLTGLTADTDYVFRAVATHTSGTLTGEEVTFHTPKAAPTATGSITVTVNSAPTGRAVIVSVEAGNDAIASKGGNTNCSLTFSNLPDGFYNVVVRTTDGDYTETRMIEVANGGAAATAFDIPVGKLATVVDVKTEDTPKTAVEGLNEIITAAEKDAAAAGAQDVEVKLEVEKKPENAAEGAAAIKALDSNKIDIFLDLSLWKTTTTLDPQGEAESVETADIGSSNNRVLEIAIPYANVTRTGLKMYRYHNSMAEVLTALAAKPLGGRVDGTYYLDKISGYIFLYASGFSTYAIGFGDNGDDGGGYYLPTTYPVNTEEPTGGTVTASHKRASKDTVITLTVTPDEGYELLSIRATDEDGGELEITQNDDGTYSFTMPAGEVNVGVAFRKFRANPEVTGVADWLITDEHIAYISGYPDGTAAPQGNITRAEVAMIFYRLLKNKNVEITVSFPDVMEGMWYAEAVNVLGSLSIIKGRTDGRFDSGAKITRAEFAAIATRFAYSVEGKSEFSDVPENYWAYGNISAAATYGWVEGYEDGAFLPNGDITRAEVAAIVNRMLGRAADEAYVAGNADQLKQFPDLQDTKKWYYLDMVEATNEHDFTVTDGLEKWNP